MNREAKRNFVIGRVMNRLRPDGPSAVIAERSRISSITTEIAMAAPNSTGREKKIVKSCTGPSLRLRTCGPMLAEPPVGEGGGGPLAAALRGPLAGAPRPTARTGIPR